MQALVAVMRAWLLDVDWRLMQLHLWVAIYHHVMLDSFHLTRRRHETILLQVLLHAEGAIVYLRQEGISPFDGPQFLRAA